ncbi:TlyA family RNA methyltransferase [Bifidobacterium choerinum]|uniref:Hemolysin A n=2 Tax=Bifidobacterium choerinum TaxID=35760 RepID=A0A087AEZ5_9BIFI|nr:TlyA family RNA methyltransferase [Bifidobacterium choerinum]KFI57345.1 hemolysin A [Bifidobacterium choerinum]
MGADERLDVAMTARALAPSRAKARRLVDDGHVYVDGVRAGKASMKVGDDARIEVRDADDYVSRGAYKLLGAFDVFAADGLTGPRGLDCLDIGASTGGFCDVLLRGGARHVIALDVGHGQLDSRIADDARVIEMSGVNIRNVEADDLPYRPQMIVSDVSFISLTYVLPVVARIAAPGAQVVLLVKPQFEVGRAGLGKHGIVTDPAKRRAALDHVVECARAYGMHVVATAPSPIEGTHGNIEYLLYARTD